MKYVRQYLATFLVAFAALGFVSTSANAALITQDVLLDGGAVGSITVNTADGFNSDIPGVKEMVSFVEFTMFGRDMGFLVFDFFAMVDNLNPAAGIEFLSFDTESFDGFIFQGIYDSFAADPALDNFLDVFTLNGPILFGELSLGQAAVVSEPHAALLFLTAGLALFIRRKRA